MAISRSTLQTAAKHLFRAIGLEVSFANRAVTEDDRLCPELDSKLHARHLAAIPSGAGPYRRPVEGWGRSFAKRQGLDPAPAQHRAAMNRVVSSLRIRCRRFGSVLGHYSVGLPDQPVAGVNKVCLAARAARMTDPGHITNIIRLLGRLLRAD
jgi:hypothetical protein